MRTLSAMCCIAHTYPCTRRGERARVHRHAADKTARVQWMPAWEKGAPLKMMEWLPTPSFPGGGEVDLPMPDARMKLKYRRPDEQEGAEQRCKDP